jgi:hypothetical protein
MREFVFTSFLLLTFALLGCSVQNADSDEKAIVGQYPVEEINKCNNEVGEGSKPWANRYGLYLCGCTEGYVSKYRDGKQYCEKLAISGEDYCVQKYGSRWTMNDLYGSCDCKPGYAQSDDGSFRCFTPAEYCIFLGQTGEKCLNTIQQVSDLLYEDGKLTPR